MLKIKSKIWLFLAIGLANFVLVGCNTTPDEKQLDEWKNLEGPGEMKPGAGLFSGQDGQGESHLVVQVAPGSVDPPLGPHRVSQHLLDRGLSR